MGNTMLLTSRKNPTVLEAASLSTDKKARDKTGLFAVEGKKLLAALKAAHKKMSVKLLKDVIACGMIPEDVQYFDGVPYEEEV